MCTGYSNVAVCNSAENMVVWVRKAKNSRRDGKESTRAERKTKENLEGPEPGGFEEDEGASSTKEEGSGEG